MGKTTKRIIKLLRKYVPTQLTSLPSTIASVLSSSALYNLLYRRLFHFLFDCAATFCPFRLRGMGAVNSTGNKLEKALAADLPEDERYFGLENFGNTCYCNSVLQALYFCEPFRRAVLEYDRHRRMTKAISEKNDRTSFLSTSSATSSVNGGLKNAVKGVVGIGTSTTSSNSTSASGNGANGSHDANADTSNSALPTTSEETMLTALSDLFGQISTQKRRTGSVPPKSFVNKLRQENELFSSYMHQDAHEFLNFILNDIVDCLRREAATQQRKKSGSAALEVDASSTTTTLPNKTPPNGHLKSVPDTNSPSNSNTFVHDLFEGQLSNEVRCLCCETVTCRVESFFDLSVDVAQNSSLTACLRNFSSTELLEKQDKFYCDACCSLQEAERRMRIKRLPQILALHLKRFKYVEQFGKYKKLSYRVVFPLELRLCNTSDDAEDPDRLYSLFAVVVHVGSGPNQGHYVSLIKSHGQWLMFDDDCVEPKDESELQNVFGITQDSSQSTEAGYILFYEQISSNT